MKTATKTRIMPIAVILLLLSLTPFCARKIRTEKIPGIRKKIVTLATSLTGLSYKFGGTDINGFDCSGFVHYVYGCFGYQVPRTAEKQGRLKKKVPFKLIRQADLLVFRLKKMWHSGIFIGDNQFVHALNKSQPIKKEQLNTFWKSRLRSVVNLID